MQNFQALRAPLLDPRASGGWGLCPQTPNSLWRWGLRPQTPKTAPPNCEFLATRLSHFAMFIIVWGWVAFVLNNFFLDRPVANLMMLTVDVCLMLNCFLVEKFYLHYALFDFDSILLHCTKLFICQSIEREKNFWRHFWTPPQLKNPAYATVSNHFCI